jgi:hypothetical protein
MDDLMELRDMLVHHLEHRLSGVAGVEGEIGSPEEIRFLFTTQSGLDTQAVDAIQRTIVDVVEARREVGSMELDPLRAVVSGPAPSSPRF